MTEDERPSRDTLVVVVAFVLSVAVGVIVIGLVGAILFQYGVPAGPTAP